MFCKHCGKEISDISTYCPTCGTRVSAPSAPAASQAINQNSSPYIPYGVPNYGAPTNNFGYAPAPTNIYDNGGTANAFGQNSVENNPVTNGYGYNEAPAAPATDFGTADATAEPPVATESFDLGSGQTTVLSTTEESASPSEQSVDADAAPVDNFGFNAEPAAADEFAFDATPVTPVAAPADDFGFNAEPAANDSAFSAETDAPSYNFDSAPTTVLNNDFNAEPVANSNTQPFAAQEAPTSSAYNAYGYAGAANNGYGYNTYYGNNGNAQQYAAPSAPYGNVGSNVYAEQSKANTTVSAEDKPLSTWQCIGLSLLFLIPVIGLVASMAFAFGASDNQNKKALARTWLIFKLFVLALVVAAAVAIVTFPEDVLNGFTEFFNVCSDILSRIK